MVAGIIQICGAQGGYVTKMYENKQIREHVVKPYLSKVNIDSNGHYPLLPSPSFHTSPAGLFQIWNWSGLVNTILRSQNVVGQWYYKDSRICLTWRHWYNSYPEAQWVLVKRRSEDIVESCMKTGHMKAFLIPEVQRAIGVNTPQEGWDWMVQYYNQLMLTMNEELHCLIVTPEKMAQGDFSEMRKVIETLGLEWKEKEIQEYIQPKLFKGETR